MIINIALWASPELFGDFGSSGRAYWNPLINGLFSAFGTKLDGLPAWPLYETIGRRLLVVGAIYYLVSIRGPAADVEVARRARARRSSADAVALADRLHGGAASPRRAALRLAGATRDRGEVLRGELRDELVGPCSGCPSWPVAT